MLIRRFIMKAGPDTNDCQGQQILGGGKWKITHSGNSFNLHNFKFERLSQQTTHDSGKSGKW